MCTNSYESPRDWHRKDQKQPNMTNNSPGHQSVFKLAWPIALNAILLQCILIIDTVLVTPLGEESLAAMGLAASVGSIILGFLFAFSNGSQLLIAQAYGAENPVALKSGFWAGQTINWLAALTGISIIILAGETLLAAIAPTAAVAQQANAYLLIFSGVIAGVSVSQNITALFNATGNSKLPFYSNLLELPVNAGVSYALIYGLWGLPALGLSGAAWGSVIAVGTRTLFLTGCLFMTRQTFLLLAGWLKGSFTQTLKYHFKQSAPIAATFISMVLTMNVCMMLYARLGVNQFAALTLISPWVKVAGHISTAWGQATGIMVGQILGKNNRDSLDDFVQRAWRFSFVISAVVAGLHGGMFFLFEVIYPELQQETLNALWSLMPVLLVIPFIRASNIMCGHVLRAGGEAPYAFKVHAYTQWLLTVPLTALFVLYFDLSVAWIYAIILLEEIVKSVPFHRRMWSGVWKRNLVDS